MRRKKAFSAITLTCFLINSWVPDAVAIARSNHILRVETGTQRTYRRILCSMENLQASPEIQELVRSKMQALMQYYNNKGDPTKTQFMRNWLLSTLTDLYNVLNNEEAFKELVSFTMPDLPVDSSDFYINRCVIGWVDSLLLWSEILDPKLHLMVVDEEAPDAYAVEMAQIAYMIFILNVRRKLSENYSLLGGDQAGIKAFMDMLNYWEPLSDTIKPLLENIKHLYSTKWVIYGEDGPECFSEEKYPALFKHIQQLDNHFSYARNYHVIESWMEVIANALDSFAQWSSEPISDDFLKGKPLPYEAEEWLTFFEQEKQRVEGAHTITSLDNLYRYITEPQNFFDDRLQLLQKNQTLSFADLRCSRVIPVSDTDSPSPVKEQHVLPEYYTILTSIHSSDTENRVAAPEVYEPFATIMHFTPELRLRIYVRLVLDLLRENATYGYNKLTDEYLRSVLLKGIVNKEALGENFSISIEKIVQRIYSKLGQSYKDEDEEQIFPIKERIVDYVLEELLRISKCSLSPLQIDIIKKTVQLTIYTVEAIRTAENKRMGNDDYDDATPEKLRMRVHWLNVDYTQGMPYCMSLAYRLLYYRYRDDEREYMCNGYYDLPGKVQIDSTTSREGIDVFNEQFDAYVLNPLMAHIKQEYKLFYMDQVIENPAVFKNIVKTFALHKQTQQDIVSAVVVVDEEKEKNTVRQALTAQGLVENADYLLRRVDEVFSNVDAETVLLAIKKQVTIVSIDGFNGVSCVGVNQIISSLKINHSDCLL